MRKMSKLLSVLLVLTMLLSLGVTALAAGEGSITISNSVSGQTYAVYRIFDVESYSADKTSVTYKVNAAWTSFIDQSSIKGVYVDLDDQGYVSWHGTDADAAEFAKTALAYAKDNSIAAVDTKVADAATTTFAGLDLGYYLVDSSVGALCSLDTTMTSVSIEDKNPEPTVEKTVSAANAGVGDVINYTVTIHAQAGAQSYVFHDNMSEGLTFQADSVAVTVGGSALAAANYTLSTDTATADHDCTFEIAFASAYLDSITTPTDIVITYSAVLNEKAVSGTNTNDAKLDYGDNNTTTSEPGTTIVETKTFAIPVFKYTETNTGTVDDVTGQPVMAQNALDGAVFSLKSGETVLKFKAIDGSATDFVLAEDQNDAAAVSEITTPSTGLITFKGLKEGTYVLTEEKQPDGYNKLSGPITVTIDAEGALSYGETTNAAQVDVLNNAGTELPSTGGIGTTIFYIIGAVLVIGAGVALVVKKRLDAAK